MEEEKPVVKEKQPEVTETEDGGVEVSLEEETAEQKEEVKEQPKPQEQKPEKKDDITHLRNKVYAQERIISKLQRDMEQKSREVPQLQPKELDDLDELAQKDWKAAVNQLAEKKAREIFLEEQRKIQQQSQEIEFQTEMQKNQNIVLEKHPELAEDDTEKSQIFRDILARNPRWSTSVDGPLLVAYEMENELRKRGYDVDGVVTKKVEDERERIAKANTSLKSSRVTSLSGKIVLTKEQREFCDANGITYEKYASSLKLSGGGGIEL